MWTKAQPEHGGVGCEAERWRWGVWAGVMRGMGGGGG